LPTLFPRASIAVGDLGDHQPRQQASVAEDRKLSGDGDRWLGALRPDRGGDRNRGDEAFLHRSLALAREHGALGWELRAATSLARHRLERGAAPEARAVLAPVSERFTEGFDTRDLLEARRVLEAL